MDTATRAQTALDDFLSLAGSGPYPVFKQGGALTPATRAFLAALYADSDTDEFSATLRPADLVALAHEFWRWASEAGEGEQNVRLRPALGEGGRPLGCMALEIAGPDMPFLVDSVMGEFADQGIAASAMFHPIVQSESGARSFIQVLIGALSDKRAAALLQGVRATLADVRRAVGDFHALKDAMLARAAELERTRAQIPAEEIAEGVALLRWLADNRFTFLGARDYEYARDESGALLPAEPMMREETGLGLLRDPERFVLRSSSEPMLLTPEWKRLLNEPTPLVVAKSTLRSRVHRRTAADYVGVKRYDQEGHLTGETRFIGLFTTEAFTDPTRHIPYLRRRAAWAIEHSGFRAGGHSEKSFRHVIETYPREELWQMSQEELLETARAVVHLMDRPRARIFARRDRFNRFVSAIAYLPKDRFNSDLRQAVGRLLEQTYGGAVESFSPTLGEGPLARVHFIVSDIDPVRPDPAPHALDEAAAALTRKWEDDFQAALAASPMFDDEARLRVRNRFEDAFPVSYRAATAPAEALDDVVEILTAKPEEHIRVRAYRAAGDGKEILRAKIYARNALLPLSATLPIFEHMGLFVSAERNHELALMPDAADAMAQTVHIHDLEMRTEDGAALDFGAIQSAFEDAFIAIWSGRTESDGFNKLILRLGVGWREAALIRALARYRQQTGLDPSQLVQEQALAAHPQIAALIIALFRVRFDPDLPEDIDARRNWANEVQAKIDTALNDVASLDEDRVLRRLAALVSAMTRTNYYQRDAAGAFEPFMSFKIASRELADLPAPKPYREIWVAGPLVEGVHIRFGPIARGGLRWSDRRDDFRTEVLDLVKAQQVKNAIIVPVGAKGGFYPKQLPPRGAQNYQEAGIAAYRTFLRGLLDITDNLDGDTVKPPAQTVRWDGDDPYLVVAADKGTATFSDIANGLAQEYGFWLDDAFASGGSAGYDHKAMGITARGAWEAVKRHFRELGKNIQTEPFDVIGVGDMSGDVFGNGMLLSKKIRLRAAFDHRHIFIDPSPKDLDAAWAERKRMFDLPRSSWDDYNKSLISEGGGVFARSLKSIPITPEIAALTGISQQAATPSEIIVALLKCECELLWFGGIGTFIKARAESNSDVGDKANDANRIDAESVRAKVIGEGANLGVTQAGRVAYARKGGRINSDAIDNSAGVDTSDHEVNIKILLGEAIRTKALKAADRNRLLTAMTEDVAKLVLKDNYDQTLALTLSETSAVADLDSHERMMERLEAAGKLSRSVEGLPGPEDIRALRAGGLGLTRPDLAKLIAYAKIDLFDALMESSAPDDPAFEKPLAAYFPPQLGKYEDAMKRHRLRRAIVATYLADDIVNTGGPTFVDRVRETVRATPVAIACAFEAARRIYDSETLSARVNALDNASPAAAQTKLHQAVAAALRHAMIYLVRHARVETRGIDEIVAQYKPVANALLPEGARGLTEVERRRFEERKQSFIDAGTPPDIAADIALLEPLTGALAIADLAQNRRLPIVPASNLYRAIGAEFGLDASRAAASTLTLPAHWDRLAMRRTIEFLHDTQASLSDIAAQRIGDSGRFAQLSSAMEAVQAWAKTLGDSVAASRATIAQLEADGGWTFAKLTLAAAELRALADAAAR
ncbi:MAG: NAD-glutamate dehydrogenase [Caulobacterales bacterium]